MMVAVVLIGGGDGTISKFDQEELVSRAHCTLRGAVVGMSHSQDRLEVSEARGLDTMSRFLQIRGGGGEGREP